MLVYRSKKTTNHCHKYSVLVPNPRMRPAKLKFQLQRSRDQMSAPMNTAKLKFHLQRSRDQMSAPMNTLWSRGWMPSKRAWRMRWAQYLTYCRSCATSSHLLAGSQLCEFQIGVWKLAHQNLVKREFVWRGKRRPVAMLEQARPRNQRSTRLHVRAMLVGHHSANHL